MIKKFIYSIIIVTAGFLLWTTPANAGSCSSTGTASAWASITTWTVGCTGPDGLPADGDSVTIAYDVAINSTTTAYSGSLTVNTGKTLTIDSTGSLTASGNLLVSGTGVISGTGSLNLTGNSTTIDGTGSINLTGTKTITNSKTISAAANLNFGGASGTIVVSSGTTTISSGAIITIASTTTAALTCTGIVDNQGTVKMTGSTTNVTLGGAGTFTNNTNATLEYMGGSPGVTTLTATASGNTVDYNRNGAQTCKVVTYYNLKLTGGNTKTCNATTVSGDMTVDSTAAAVTWTVGASTNIAGNLIVTGIAGRITILIWANTFTVTVTGNTQVGYGSLRRTGGTDVISTGTFTVPNGTSAEIRQVALTVSSISDISGTFTTATSATGALTFTGKMTVASTGSFTNAINKAITFGAGIENHGTFNSGTGTHTFGASQEFSGDAAMTFGQNPVTIATNRTLTNSNTAGIAFTALTIASAANHNGLTLSSGSITTVTNALTYTANAGSQNQTITINGNASLSVGSIVINAPSSTGLSRILCTDGATGTLAVGTTIAMTGNSGGAGTADIYMYTCTLSVGGLVTLNSGSNATGGITSIWSTTGTLTFSNGLTFAGASVARTRLISQDVGTINFAGTMQGGGTVTINADATLYTTGDTTALNTAATWRNVTVSSGTTTLGAATTVSTNLTINGTLNDGGYQITGNATNTLTMGPSSNLTLGGAAATTFPTLFTQAHTSLDPTSTVTYKATGADQTISATPVYGNLILSPTLAAANRVYTFAAGAVTVNGNYTINPSGTANSLTVNTGGNITVATDKTTTIQGSGSATSSLVTYINPNSYNLSTGILTISAGGTLNAASSSSIISINSTTPYEETPTIFSNAGTFTAGSSTVKLAGSGVLSLTVDPVFYNLTITGWSDTANSFSVKNNWTNSGRFTATAGIVTFNGTGAQTLTGTENNFLGLAISGTATRTVTVNGGTVLSVAANGSLALSGIADHLLTLASNGSTDWYLRVSNTDTTAAVSYVNASHSDAGNYKQIVANDGTSVDGGDDINWLFSEATPTPAPGFRMSGIKLGGGIKIDTDQSTSWACGQDITDSRDSQVYPTVLIGTQCWLAKSINIGTKIDGGTRQGTTCPSAAEIEKYCYSNSEANCTTYGALYEWGQVMCGSSTPGDTGICPTDWHIPTEAELYTLESGLATGACTSDRYGYSCDPAGTALKSGGSSGFNLLLGGTVDNNGTFSAIDTEGSIWSSTLSNPSYYWMRYVNSAESQSGRWDGIDVTGYSARCLKDS